MITRNLEQAKRKNRKDERGGFRKKLFLKEVKIK